MLVKMTSRIIQHGSLRRRVIVLSEWNDRVRFWGKALENYSCMFKKHFRNQIPWVPPGFCSRATRSFVTVGCMPTRPRPRDERRSRSLFKTQPKAETAHERPLTPRVETKGHFQGMPNTYHPVDKMPFNLRV